MPEQSYKNHARWHPLFHFFLMPLNLVLFISSIVHVVQEHSRANILLVPVTFSLMLGTLMIRMYGAKNQDRIIRLEETLRLRSLGCDCTGLTEKQCVAIRFASDAEVVALAQRATAEKMEPKAIKAAIITWRPDHNRV
jgi:hypothetical protein